MKIRVAALVLLTLVCGAVCFAQTSASSNVFPIQEGFVDSHGALIYYVSMGRGAPLVIAHGGPGASHVISFLTYCH
jgi:hypothetical protein